MKPDTNDVLGSYQRMPDSDQVVHFAHYYKQQLKQKRFTFEFSREGAVDYSKQCH